MNTSTYLTERRHFVDRSLALQERVQTQHKAAIDDLARYKGLLALTEQVRELFIAATAATQEQVKEFIEEMVSLALQSVFGNEYWFTLESHSRRGQPEMEPIILWKQERLSPKGEVGGGVIDVVSFALRLVLWVLSSNKSSPTFILDEPFKFLSKDRTDAAASMIKGIADLLGIQIIMVSHDLGLIDTASKSWTVRRGPNGVAEVSENV